MFQSDLYPDGTNNRSRILILLVLSLLGGLIELGAAPGDLLWKYPLPQHSLAVGPGFGQDGTAYVLTVAPEEQVHLIAISTNGVPAWSTPLGFTSSRPQLNGSGISFVCVAPDGDLVAGFGRQVSRVAADGTLR
ncbi:MAG TPA: hypothetical protein PKW90_23135, partial [Myxococcota bacterium]|nr:hypothetical protein [Myxococcota bacterium]